MSGPTPGARWEVSILLGAHTSEKVQDRDVAQRRCNEDVEQPSQFVQVYVHGHHDGYLPPVSSPWLAGRPMRDGQGARVPLQASVLPGSTTLTRSYRRARTSRRRSPAPLPTRGRDLQPEISSSRAPEPCIHTREVTVATREADLDDLTDTHDEPDHHVLAAPTSAFGETSDVKVSRCRWSRAIRGNLGLFIAVVSQISLVSPGPPLNREACRRRVRRAAYVQSAYIVHPQWANREVDGPSPSSAGIWSSALGLVACHGGRTEPVRTATSMCRRRAAEDDWSCFTFSLR